MLMIGFDGQTITDSTRIIVWFGDASGHDPSGGVSLAGAIADLVASEIQVIAVPVDSGFGDGLDATGQATAELGVTTTVRFDFLSCLRLADGWIVVGGANQANWQRLAEVLEAPELAEDPRFRDNDGRMAHLKELEAELNARFRRRGSEEWLALLDAAGVPAGPVYDIAQMHRDPQVLARDMVVEVEHSTLGRVKTLGLPIKFSDTPGGPRRGAPLFGEHSRAILAEQGFGPEEIEALIASGAVAAEAPAEAGGPDGPDTR